MKKKFVSKLKIKETLKRWGLYIFYTAFFMVAMYFMILVGTTMIPAFMNYVFIGLGFTFKTFNEIIIAGLSGLFFVAWVFTASLKLGMIICRKYINSMKKLFPNKFLEDK